MPAVHSGRGVIGNPNGQTLVQILISVGLMSILMVAFATMMANQSRETGALTEKLAAMDFQQLLTSSLADGSVCQYVLNSPTQLTFDSTNLPQTITLTNPTAATAALYSSILPGPSPGPIIAQVGAAASPISNSLIVKSVQLQILAGSGSSYTGTWLVNFDSSKTVRAIKPAAASVILTIDSTVPTAATIKECQSAVTPRGTYQTFCGWTAPWPQVSENCSPAPCSASDTLLDHSCYLINVWSNNWLNGVCANTCVRGAGGGQKIQYTSRCGWAKDMQSQAGYTNNPGSCTPNACASSTILVSSSCYATVPWWGAGWWAIGVCDNICATP